MSRSLKDAILDELEITQGTADNIAIILGETTSSVSTVLKNLLREDEVRLVDHPKLTIYRLTNKPTKNNPTPP